MFGPKLRCLPANLREPVSAVCGVGADRIRDGRRVLSEVDDELHRVFDAERNSEPTRRGDGIRRRSAKGDAAGSPPPSFGTRATKTELSNGPRFRLGHRTPESIRFDGQSFGPLGPVERRRHRALWCRNSNHALRPVRERYPLCEGVRAPDLSYAVGGAIDVDSCLVLPKPGERRRRPIRPADHRGTARIDDRVEPLPDTVVELDDDAVVLVGQCTDASVRSVLRHGKLRFECPTEVSRPNDDWFGFARRLSREGGVRASRIDSLDRDSVDDCRDVSERDADRPENAERRRPQEGNARLDDLVGSLEQERVVSGVSKKRTEEHADDGVSDDEHLPVGASADRLRGRQPLEGGVNWDACTISPVGRFGYEVGPVRLVHRTDGRSRALRLGGLVRRSPAGLASFRV
nr:hypothetical protein [Halogeometricum rufum]